MGSEQRVSVQDLFLVKWTGPGLLIRSRGGVSLAPANIFPECGGPVVVDVHFGHSWFGSEKAIPGGVEEHWMEGERVTLGWGLVYQPAAPQVSVFGDNPFRLHLRNNFPRPRRCILPCSPNPNYYAVLSFGLPCAENEEPASLPRGGMRIESDRPHPKSKIRAINGWMGRPTQASLLLKIPLISDRSGFWKEHRSVVVQSYPNSNIPE